MREYACVQSRLHFCKSQPQSQATYLKGMARRINLEDCLLRHSQWLVQGQLVGRSIEWMGLELIGWSFELIGWSFELIGKGARFSNAYQPQLNRSELSD
jgi:hypothetical protein